MAELVAAGLSPAEALRAATWNGAVFLGATDSHGSVDPGNRRHGFVNRLVSVGVRLTPRRLLPVLVRRVKEKRR